MTYAASFSGAIFAISRLSAFSAATSHNWLACAAMIGRCRLGLRQGARPYPHWYPGLAIQHARESHARYAKPLCEFGHGDAGISENAVPQSFARVRRIMHSRHHVWKKPEEKREHPVAKATYVKTQDVWKVYWQHADLKWHACAPVPEVSKLDEFLQLVDRYACFWG